MLFSDLKNILASLVNEYSVPAVSAAVGYNGEIVFSDAYGRITESGRNVSCSTRFDIASMTKILSGICFMKMAEDKKISLSHRISSIFPEMSGIRPIEKEGVVTDYADAGRITWFEALTHTAGFGWTRPKTRPSLPHLDTGLDDIFKLPLAAKPGERIIYSDVPVILMGKAMELISGLPLDKLIKETVTDVLDMKSTGFIRLSEGISDCSDIAPTEFDSLFRKKRVWGTVHDENAYLLDGVAAHAGIFSTANDLCRLSIELNKCLKTDGIITKESAVNMTFPHVTDGEERRGLIWQINGQNSPLYTRALSEKAYGHTGFTGCFLWNDPEKNLSVVFLSNDVYNGRNQRIISNYRKYIINSVVNELK